SRGFHSMPARRPAVRGFAGSAAALLGVGLVGFTAAPAAADPFSADTAAALVDAIEEANDTPGADVITITAPITLTSGLPAIEADLENIGGGRAISAAGFGGLVVTGDVSVSIAELEVVGASGHGIVSDGADLLLDDVLVDGSGGDGLNAVGGSVTVIASDF